MHDIKCIGLGKCYIGESVFAYFDGETLWLHTENEKTTTNIIALKSQGLQILLDYIRRNRIPPNQK